MRRTRPGPGRVVGYGISVLSVALAFAVTRSTWPLFQPTPWALFFAAVMTSAWFGGMGPSLVAIGLSAALGHLHFIAPRGAFSLERGSVIPTFTFLSVSSFIALLASVRRRAEAFERAERRRFRATMASIGDAVIATDPEGRVTFMNGIAERLTGWSFGEAEGRPLEDVFVIINEETGAFVANPVVKVLETGLIQGLANHTILISKDGVEWPIDDSAAPIREDGERIRGVVLVFREITERKRAEDATRLATVEAGRTAEANAKFRAMFDQGARLAALLAPDGTVIGVNRLALEASGAAREEVVGRPYWESAPWDRPPELRDTIRSACLRAVEGQPIRAEVAYPAPGGGDRVIDLVIDPVTDDEGRILFLALSGTDITDRKRAERALRESATRHRFLADLAAATQPLTDPAEVMAVASRRLAEHLDATRCAYAEVEDQAEFVITGDYTRGVPSIVGRWPVAAFGAECLRLMLADEPYVVDDTDLDPRIGPDDLPAYRATTIRAVICMPLHKDGKLTAAMAVHQDSPRRWTTSEVALVATVAARCWEALERSRVTRTLRESEARFRAIVEASPECVKLVAPDGTLLQINPAGLGMIEGDESTLGLRVYDVIAPEFRQIYGEFNERVCRGERGTLEFDIIGLRGTRRHMETTAVPLPAPQGGFNQLSVTRDVTTRRRDAAALREKEERLKLLVENTRDYAVVISDPDGKIIEWEGAAERITGYSPAEAIGQGPGLIFTPEDRTEGKPEAEMARAARDGRAEDKRWHQRKDGSRFYADGVMTALFAENLRGFGKVFKDATREKRAEEAARRRAVQLHKLAGIAGRINSAHDVHSVIRVVTEEARDLVDAHRAATTMILDPDQPTPINVVSDAGGRPNEPPPELDPLAFAEALDRADAPIRLSRREIDAGPAWQALRRIAFVDASPDGWLAAPLVGRDGRSLGLIQLSGRPDGEFTDDDEAILVQLSQLAVVAIENARLYDELRGNDERKNEFLAMLAHELRNPLAAIGNAVQLTSRADAKEHRDWSLEVIHRQMRHLSRLIDDLMDVSRITRGKIELRRDVLELTPILESAAATVRALVEERKHSLVLDLERGKLWVHADPTRLEQVIVNLLNNAAKYSENAGHIRLSARAEGSEVVIAVRDRGVGIAPEKLPEMFELFAQGDRSLARSEGGLGIGLTVVKKLVEMHGGGIVARSEGPGQGSEFLIRLPAASPAEPTAPESSPSTKPAEARKARILVVDDNVDTARGMARLLKLLGHEVASAHSGPEALELARDLRPEFVLLDIGLPGMSGYEVAAQLRREEETRDAVIVAVSGYGQEEDRRRSRQAGFDFHLVKPLDHDALLTLLSNGGDAAGS